MSANTLFTTGISPGRSPETQAIVERWLRCPDDVPECDGSRHYWPCDQGAWNTYIRPTLHPGQLVLVPCAEANGFPDAPSSHSGGTCMGGQYLSHYWIEKFRLQELLDATFHENAKEAVLGYLRREGDLRILQ